MNTISFSEGGNVGGIRELYLAPFYTLDSDNPITFKTGYDWTMMDFLPESASCKDSSTETDNGAEYSYALVLGFNKQSKTLYNAFRPYIGRRGILKFTDNNGLTRVLGTIKNPVTLKCEGDTGNNPTDANNYKITIAWLNDTEAVAV